MADVFAAPADFNSRIIGITPPSEPAPLPEQRKRYVTEHIGEELGELYEATTVVDQADALLDIIFIASGRLFELGLAPHVSQALWDEVCRANGGRVRGDNAKRPNAVGFDAVKPAGWVGPDLEGVLELHRSSLEADGFITCHSTAQAHIDALRPPRALLERPSRPKVLLLGQGRHGKDTVAEIMRDRFGFTFQSSSMFCAERVVLPAFLERGFYYASAEDCYADRHGSSRLGEHRAFWFDRIAEYNRPDPSRLAREMLAENDIYVGMRGREEYEACMEAELFDHVVWVDAFGRGLPLEGSDSFNIPFDALTMRVVHNDGSLEDLEGAVAALVQSMGESR